jgi:hypothetical protein
MMAEERVDPSPPAYSRFGSEQLAINRAISRNGKCDAFIGA